ncbi:MAG: DUF302 domain-containing protein [Bauldia sp.]|nr:DUF302 domain-containing protein [Bauldia sp.]MCW5717902.1 DUF302 domain-containing protein [Bauldia sp.]
MSFYFSTTLSVPFAQAIADVTAALAKRGFGVLTDIDVQGTLKRKLDVDIPPYRILGACNPQMAFAALQIENKIGTMLPCNVVVRDAGGGAVEVAAVDPVASMMGIEKPALGEVAKQVRELLEQVIADLSPQP